MGNVALRRPRRAARRRPGVGLDAVQGGAGRVAGADPELHLRRQRPGDRAGAAARPGTSGSTRPATTRRWRAAASHGCRCPAPAQCDISGVIPDNAIPQVYDPPSDVVATDNQRPVTRRLPVLRRHQLRLLRPGLPGRAGSVPGARLGRRAVGRLHRRPAEQPHRSAGGADRAEAAGRPAARPISPRPNARRRRPHVVGRLDERGVVGGDGLVDVLVGLPVGGVRAVVEGRARAGAARGQRQPGREPESRLARRGSASVDADVAGEQRVPRPLRARVRRRAGGDGGGVRPGGGPPVVVAGRRAVQLDLGPGPLPGVPGRQRAPAASGTGPGPRRRPVHRGRGRRRHDRDGRAELADGGNARTGRGCRPRASTRAGSRRTRPRRGTPTSSRSGGTASICPSRPRLGRRRCEMDPQW